SFHCFFCLEKWCTGTLRTSLSSRYLNHPFDFLLNTLNFLTRLLGRIPFLLFLLLLRCILRHLLMKADFLFFIFKMCKFKHSAKLTMNFLAQCCGWLFAFVSKIDLGQEISRDLNLRQGIHQ